MGEKGDTQAGKLYAHPATRLALLSLSALAVSTYVLVKSPVVVAGHTEPTTPLAYQHALVVQSGLPSLGLLLVMLYILLLKNTKDALNAASGPWRRLRLGSFRDRADTAWLRALSVGLCALWLGVLPWVQLALAETHFQSSLFQLCAEPSCPASSALNSTQAHLPSAVDSAHQTASFREIRHDSRWQQFLLHIAPQHWWTNGSFTSRYFQVAPGLLPYLVPLQGWFYLAILIVCAWLWLRIMVYLLRGHYVPDRLATQVAHRVLIRIGKVDAPIDADPLPGPCIRIGVIGNRILSAEQHARVEQALDRVLSACQRPNYGLRIIAGMASGVDRLAVDWALARSRQGNCQLLAILPGSSKDFGAHSGVLDKAAYCAQLAQVEANDCARLLELPGELQRGARPARSRKWVRNSMRIREAKELDQHRNARIAAHRHKSNVLLRQCEFLIAALDLNDPGKPGGTRECVEAALALATPVFILDIQTGDMGFITRVDQLRPGGIPPDTTGQDSTQALAAVLEKRLWPVDDDGIPENLGALRRIYSRAEPTALSRYAIWWQRFENCFIGAKPAQNSSAPSATPDYFEKLRKRISDDQGKLMAAYRGSFVLAYLLGCIAVLLALLVAFLFWHSGGKAIHWMLPLTLLKLSAIGLIAWIISRSASEKLSEVAVALRYVSERLRIMPTLSLLGSARLDLLHQTQRMGLPAEIAADLCRRVSLDEITARHTLGLDHSACLKSLKTLQAGQESYNHNQQLRSAKLHEKLETQVRTFSQCVLSIVAMDVLLLCYKGWMLFDPHPEPQDRSIVALLGMSLVLITALLPAVIAAINAIIFQSQTEQLAERQQDLVKTMRELQDRSQKLDTDIQAQRVAAPIAAAILSEAERTAAVLAEEVAEWAVMSRQSLRDSG